MEVKMETSSFDSFTKGCTSDVLEMPDALNRSSQKPHSSASSITMPSLAMNSRLLLPLKADRVFAPTEVTDRMDCFQKTGAALLFGSVC